MLIPRLLAVQLARCRLSQGRGGTVFVFSADGERPFDAPSALKTAKRAWVRAGLDPIGFHECRHRYAAFMIAAGVNTKALSTYMALLDHGHAGPLRPPDARKRM